MKQYNKWELVSRMPGFLIRVACILFLICNLMWLVVYPELIHRLWFVLLLVLLELIALILSLKIYKEYIKVCHILKNKKIIQSKVLRAVSTRRFIDDSNVDFMFKYSPGDVYIETMYFDEENNYQYLFTGYFDLPIYSKNNLFKQGKGLKDLKYLDVLVNAMNYNEYIILFGEELSELKLF